MEYLIRKCNKKDLPSLVELCMHHAVFEKAKYSPKGKADLLQVALFSRHPKLFCYVIEINQELQGYFSYTLDYSTWDTQSFLHLDCLYLEPQYRGQGIGKKVFHKLIDIGKQHNCVNIQWQTPVFNKNAIRFYEQLGGVGKNKKRFSLPLLYNTEY